MRRRNFLGSDAMLGGALAACASSAAVAAGAAGAIGERPAAAGTVAGWNRLALQAIDTLQPGAAVAARSLAILHTCMYNAWAAYDDDARQTAQGVAVRLPRAERSAASKASAMSHAACLALRGQFPSLSASFEAWMAGLGLDPSAPSGQLSPAGIGRTQAAAMLDACRDGGEEPPDLPVAPAAGARTGKGDGSGAGLGQWCRLAQSLSARERHDDDQDVRLFFALANALADALADVHADTAGAEGGNQSEDACGAAAHEVLRRFTGKAPAGAAQHERGREAGGRAYDRARRYWDGKL